MTTHRRVAAVPQLTCKANPQSLCDLYTIDTMRCTNQGSGYDAEDIQWSCTASLPPELKLGGTEVVCEGYSSGHDPYVLKGSCAVEYKLLLTDLGEQRYPELASESQSYADRGADMLTWAFWAIFAAVVVWIVYSAFWGDRDADGNRRNNRPGGGFWGGGGGGGGGPGFGPDNDPPPPYPGQKPWGGSQQQQQQQQGWRPGFWTGAATGAAAAYLAGNRNNDRNNFNNNNRLFNNDGYGLGSRGGSVWGGGGGGGSAGRSSTSTRPNVSSARQQSTGFGGTQRR